MNGQIHTTEEKEFYTVKDIAQELGVSDTLIYEAAYIGKLEGEKLNNTRWRFTRAQIDDFKQKRLAEVPRTAFALQTQLPDEVEEENVILHCQLCHRALGRNEYHVRSFIDEKTKEPVFKPVCRDARCDPREQARRSKLKMLRDANEVMARRLEDLAGIEERYAALHSIQEASSKRNDELRHELEKQDMELRELRVKHAEQQTELDALRSQLHAQHAQDDEYEAQRRMVLEAAARHTEQQAAYEQLQAELTALKIAYDEALKKQEALRMLLG